MSGKRKKWLKKIAIKYGHGNKDFRILKKIYKEVGHEKFLIFIAELERST